MTTIRRSCAIFVESLGVLSKDKGILVFPLLSGIVTIIAFLSMVFAGAASGVFQRFERRDPLTYAVLFVWYFVSWFIVLFFNVAVIHCASIRVRGGDPTIADGFRAATQHLGRIAHSSVVWHETRIEAIVDGDAGFPAFGPNENSYPFANLRFSRCC